MTTTETEADLPNNHSCIRLINRRLEGWPDGLQSGFALHLVMLIGTAGATAGGFANGVYHPSLVHQPLASMAAAAAVADQYRYPEYVHTSISFIHREKYDSKQ